MGSGGTSGGLISLGGCGSNGGSSDTVTIINNASGSITTSGIGSDGIFAQSVGGSGGSGSDSGGLVSVGGSGANAGDGGVVIVENYGTIETTKDGARGIVAQSIGGGGGDGGNSGGMVAVGGSGAGGGIGNTVTVKQGGTITTEGDDATAIFTQSVGGGGGNGGSAGSVSAFVGVAVGGKGGKGGAGGNVNITLQGQDEDTGSFIRTGGDRSVGLFAQSVGGGGGNGGGAIQATAGFVGAVSIAVGGDGGLAAMAAPSRFQRIRDSASLRPAESMPRACSCRVSAAVAVTAVMPCPLQPRADLFPDRSVWVSAAWVKPEALAARSAWGLTTAMEI